MRKKYFVINIILILLLISCNKEKDKDNFYYIEPPVPNRTFLVPSMNWNLSSTPLLFPESNVTNDLSYGYNRAKISWYNIDPMFQTHNPLVPAHLSPTAMSHDYVRYILETEVYPNKDIPSGTPTPLTSFNIDFYPSKIGPYNYDTEPSSFSSGIDESANLLNPDTRWGGISRVLNYIDHDINYIDFWMMDPFIDNENISGDLYINIGSFSEEILSDNIHQNESSISDNSSDNDTNTWGIHGLNNSYGFIFINTYYQDFGLDGLNNTQEKSFFNDYLSKVSQICTPMAYNQIHNDPSKDDYHHYRGSDYDDKALPIVARYASYNGLEGNSTQNFPVVEQYPTTSSSLPNKEDIDNSESLSLGNTYYEYHIEINNSSFVSGNNFIDSVYKAQLIQTIDHNFHTIYWYHFKLPIQDYTSTYGNIQALSELKMIRLYLTNFSEPVTLRLVGFYITE